MSAEENESFTLPSFAKINLSLRVIGRRDDGFHELCTIFQTISLKDELTFRANRQIVLTCSDRTIPTGAKNLIVRAAEKLREKYRIETGVAIHLEKNIPAPGGLGGGSSNAAVALIGLARLWKLKIGLRDLEAIGKTLGADVPFFFCGGTALGVGRGDEIYALDEIEEKNLLVVTPNIKISTAVAFANLNAVRLTNKRSKSILQICRSTTATNVFRQSDLKNDFEKTIFALEPEVARVKKTLLNLAGAKQALLSGSGASVFAAFTDKVCRQEAFERLKKEKNWRVFMAETVSRAKYQALLSTELFSS